MIKLRLYEEEQCKPLQYRVTRYVDTIISERLQFVLYKK